MRISDWRSDGFSSDRRVDRGESEQEADAAVRRRPAPLAQYAAAPALGDDRIDGQEIGRVAEPADQAQLMRDLLPTGRRHAARKPPVRTFLAPRPHRLFPGAAPPHPPTGQLRAVLAQLQPACLPDFMLPR